MTKTKILRTIQAENLVSVRSHRYINTLYWARLSFMSRLTLTCLLALVKSDVVFAVKQFATCSAVNIRQEIGIEY